ncbi:hypothetical protein HPP92_027387 [Vanilla planifolia]|uniref:Uncharacterized protein n=1 Tax=Vanilla planifolia TaxID=51239 RepID=A0A835U5P8_VANPL|nr:hypothetical protein HPP92_027387 [Vanilla planifolia]
MIYTHHVPQQFSSLAPLFCNLQHRPPLRLPSHFSLISVAVRLSSRTAVLQPALAVLPDSPAPTSPTEESEGPVEMPPSSSSTLFDVDDNPTPLQAAASVLLSGAIAIFLFRSLRRRAKRVKEMRVRSTGLTKVEGLKEESLDSLFTGGINPVDAEGPPSPVQALLGGLVAGIIAVILYKFTTTIEAALNRQAISDNFSETLGTSFSSLFTPSHAFAKMSQKGRNKVETEEEKSLNWFPKFFLLFDEHWFFYNALYPSQEKKTTSAMAGKLLRTPSLPPPPVDQGEEKVAENSDTKTRGRRKLSYSSSLDSPRKPISSFSASSLSSSSTKQSREKQEPPRREPAWRRCANPHLDVGWEQRYMKSFQNKKWSSASDLELMELQGFKDLGFVSEDREGMNSSSLVRVGPEQRVSKEEHKYVGNGGTYLSEARLIRWSAPPLDLRRLSLRSPEMKEELRFWARAVARCVRKECWDIVSPC